MFVTRMPYLPIALAGLLVFATLCFAQTTAPAIGSTTGPGGIVALVGDEVITQADLDKWVERRRAWYLARMPASAVDREHAWLERDELERRIGDKLILQLVKLEEKKGEGPYISEVQVDAEISRKVVELKKQGERVKDAGDLYRFVREQEGMSREEYRQNTRERMSIATYLWQKVFKSNDEFVPPQEMKAYYQSHLEEFATPAEVSFRQIKIKRTRDNRMGVLVDLVRKGLKEKLDFVEISRRVAELQGDDPEEGERIFTRNAEELSTWKKPLRDLLLRMKKGEASDVIETPQDIYFFRVEEMKQGTPRPFEEVQEEISKRVREEKNQNSYDAFLARQRKKTRVEVYLPPLAGGQEKKE